MGEQLQSACDLMFRTLRTMSPPLNDNPSSRGDGEKTLQAQGEAVRGQLKSHQKDDNSPRVNVDVVEDERD